MTTISQLKLSLDRSNLLEKATRALVRTEVLVGIPDSGAERQPEPGQPNPPSSALIGYVQEMGDDELHIPPRPFLVPGVQSVQDKIVGELTAAGIVAMNGGTGQQVQTSFERIGIIAQNAVQAKITDGPFTPLAPRTLAARRAKGRTGEKPLLDSGQLRRAVTYTVKSK